jgi:two-component system OmpR family sensor kinase
MPDRRSIPGRVTESWNRISLRTKITGVTVLLLTLGLLVAGVGSGTVLRNYLLDEVDSGLRDAMSELDGSARDALCSVSSNSPNPNFLAVIMKDGSRCDNYPTGVPMPVLTSLTLSKVSTLESPITVPSSEPGEQWRVWAQLATIEGTTDFVIVVVARDLTDTNSVVSRYAAIFLFFGLTVVILGGALTRLLVTSTFAPLRDTEQTAARFAAGDLSQRIAGATPNTEVGRLNRSLNAMLNRIDQAFADRARTIEQMRRFVGDASHELRTPLVSVRGYAELYRMGALTTSEDVAQAMDRIEKEAVRMGGLVEDLLALARLDEAKPLELAEVDLVPLANDTALDAMASAPDRVVTVVVTEAPDEPLPVTRPMEIIQTPTTPSRGVSMATGPIAFAGATLARLVARRSRATGQSPVVAPEPPSPALGAIVLAEENKVRQVLANLVGNALRFTPEGSPIEIGVGVDVRRDVATLSVIDHGEGVPAQQRAKIFQRFWRADSSRSRDSGGSGLGLAIVAAIVEAHKGTVDVLQTPGGGATFRVSLPLLHPSSGDEQPTAAP